MVGSTCCARSVVGTRMIARTAPGREARGASVEGSAGAGSCVHWAPCGCACPLACPWPCPKIGRAAHLAGSCRSPPRPRRVAGAEARGRRASCPNRTAGRERRPPLSPAPRSWSAERSKAECSRRPRATHRAAVRPPASRRSPARRSASGCALRSPPSTVHAPPTWRRSQPSCSRCRLLSRATGLAETTPPPTLLPACEGHG